MPRRKFMVVLSATERAALRRLAEAEERSMAAMVRRLLRTEAQRRGLWPTAQDQAQEVQHA